MSPQINRSRTSARALSTLALAGLLAAGGCGHGKYTSEHISNAEKKLSVLKSGTEWNMAHQQFMAGDLDKAIKSVDMSIALNPEVPKAHNLRGRILVEKGELEAARAAFQKAIELDAEYAEPHYFLGIIYERFRRVDNALASYSKASAIESSNPQYLVAQAEMLISLDRLDEADALLRERREVFQYNGAVRHTMGQIATLRGDHRAAAALLDEALLLSPDDQGILEDLVRAQIASEIYADAERNIARLLDMTQSPQIEANREKSKDRLGQTKTPKLARRDLQHMRAKCLVKLDRPVEARTILLDLVASKDGASDFRAWVELGKIALVLNDLPRLRNAASRAIALQPDEPDGYVLRALFLRRSGDNNGALESLRKATSLTVNDASTYMLHALVARDLGKPDEARDALVNAVRLEPENQQAKALYRSLNSGQAITTVPTE